MCRCSLTVFLYPLIKLSGFTKLRVYSSDDQTKVWHFDDKIGSMAINSFGDFVYLGFGNGMVVIFNTNTISGSCLPLKPTHAIIETEKVSGFKTSQKQVLKNELPDQKNLFKFESTEAKLPEPKVDKTITEDMISSDIKTPNFSLPRSSGSKLDFSVLKRQILVLPIDDFRCFKIHKDAVTSILYLPEENRIVTGSSTGEICLFNDKGVIVKRKEDSNIEILQFKLVNRTPVFFENIGAAKNAEMEHQRVFSAFSKVIGENAFTKNEMVVIKNRFKKIAKKKPCKLNLIDFLSSCVVENKGKTEEVIHPGVENKGSCQVEKLKKEIEDLKKVNAKLLNVCSKLDEIKLD